VQFVYLKATEGSTIVDSKYSENVKGAKKAGIPIGSYHYMTSKSSITSQFRNYYGVVNRKEQDIIPMIDIEEEGVSGWSRQEIQDSLARMIMLMEKHYHRSPIIYAYAKFYNENLAPRFNSYHLFLAHYNIHEPVVAGAGQHNLWQHSDQGVVDGIETPVDLDVFAEGTTLENIKMNQTGAER
jgi:lysozyme